MKNRFWFPISLVALLWSCGGDTAESEVLLQEPMPASPAPEVAAIPSTSPLAQYAEARGMSALEPRVPNKHFRLTGDLVFYQADQEIPQEGELWIGGADRMRFSMGVGTEFPNIFLLASPEKCWVRVYKEDFKTYDSLELWRETLIRWHTLRFPWGWQENEIGEFNLDTPLGQITLEVNDALLPSRVSLRDSHVALSEWKAADNNEQNYPMHWDWTYEGGRRVESFTGVQNGALFVDSAFTPKAEKVDRTYLLDVEGGSEMSGELLDFLHTTWQSVGLGEWMDSSSGAPGQWYEHQGEKRYVFEPGLAVQPGAKVLEERDFLVWSTLQVVSTAEALAYLETLLPRLNAAADGDLWSHITEPGREERSVFALPVVRN